MQFRTDIDQYDDDQTLGRFRFRRPHISLPKASQLRRIVAPVTALRRPLQQLTPALRRVAQVAVHPLVAINRPLLQPLRRLAPTLRRALPFAALIPGPIGLAAGVLFTLDRIRTMRALSKAEQDQYNTAANTIEANADQVQAVAQSAAPQTAPAAADQAAPAASTPEQAPEPEPIEEPAEEETAEPDTSAADAEFARQNRFTPEEGAGDDGGPVVADDAGDDSTIIADDDAGTFSTDADSDSEGATMEGISAVQDFDTEGYFFRDLRTGAGGYDDAGFGWQAPEGGLQGVGDWTDSLTQFATEATRAAMQRASQRLQQRYGPKPAAAPVITSEAAAPVKTQMQREIQDRVNWPLILGGLGVVVIGGYWLTHRRRSRRHG